MVFISVLKQGRKLCLTSEKLGEVDWK